MSVRYLVFGATGRVGSLVLNELVHKSTTPPDTPPWIGGLMRNAQRVRTGWPAGAVMVPGDFGDPASMATAMQGVDVVFLASPIHPDMAAWQCQAVVAAAHAGVKRIVKLSGSSWTMMAGKHTTVGAAHAQVEEALRSAQAAGGSHSICIRPNAFLQGMLGRVGADIQAGDTVALALDDARVAFADTRDIALAAAHAMTADTVPPVIEITGPAACGGADIAATLSRLLARPIAYCSLSIEEALARAQSHGAPAFTLQHQSDVLARLRQGAGSRVSHDFSAVTGRAPRSVESYLEEVIPSCKHS